MADVHSERDIRRLLDRAAIEDLHARYFQGIDRGDPEQVRSCFTDDVEAHYHERGSTRGIEAFMANLQNFDKFRAGTLKVTTHFMGNLAIGRLEADVAETETYAIAFLVGPDKEGDVVAMRSLRYLDRMRRDAGGWRISHRIHTLDWSCAMPTTFATTVASRVSRLT